MKFGQIKTILAPKSNKMCKKDSFGEIFWQFYQILHNWANLPKKGSIWPNCIFSQTFYPNLQIFLHGYIRHIRDSLQLCVEQPGRWTDREAAGGYHCCARTWQRATTSDAPTFYIATSRRILTFLILAPVYWRFSQDESGWSNLNIRRHFILSALGGPEFGQKHGWRATRKNLC